MGTKVKIKIYWRIKDTGRGQFEATPGAVAELVCLIVRQALFLCDDLLTGAAERSDVDELILVTNNQGAFPSNDDRER